jgi:hypothetical protein
MSIKEGDFVSLWEDGQGDIYKVLKKYKDDEGKTVYEINSLLNIKDGYLEESYIDVDPKRLTKILSVVK